MKKLLNGEKTVYLIAVKLDRKVELFAFKVEKEALAFSVKLDLMGIPRQLTICTADFSLEDA